MHSDTDQPQGDRQPAPLAENLLAFAPQPDREGTEYAEPDGVADEQADEDGNLARRQRVGLRVTEHARQPDDGQNDREGELGPERPNLALRVEDVGENRQAHDLAGDRCR